MIAFASPAAWWGAFAIAIPIAVHLVRRHRARRQPFPTLQFLSGPSVAAVRVDRVSDLGLLAVRIAIMLGAAAALAQPVWRARAGPAAASSASPARAVVVDALLGSGDPAVTRELSRLGPAAAHIEIEAVDLRAGVDQAAGWTARQEGAGEIVVVSPFPTGSFSRAAADLVPGGVGLRLIRVDSPRAGPASSGPSAIDWRAPVAERAGMDAALAAAATVGTPALSGRPITVVFADAPELEALTSRTEPIAEPWMYDVIRSLSSNGSLRAAARDATVAGRAPRFGSTPLLTTAKGDVVLDAADVDGRLLLVCHGAANSFLTAALAAGIAGAIRPPLAGSPIDRAVLTSWERAATPRPLRSPPATGWPVGRWVWLSVLLLLAVEEWLRARDRSSAGVAEARRVA